MTEPQKCNRIYYSLIVAVKQNSQLALRELADHGAEINLCLKNNRTLLHMAVKRGANGAFQWLLRHGIDIDAADNAGRTALTYALQKQNGANGMVMQLLGRGAQSETIGDLSRVHRRYAPLLAALKIDCPVLSDLYIQHNGQVRYDNQCVVFARIVGLSRYNFARWRMFEICVALQNMRLPALVTMQILEASFRYGDMIPMYRMWALITLVKHWRDKQREEQQQKQQTLSEQ